MYIGHLPFYKMNSAFQGPFALCSQDIQVTVLRELSMSQTSVFGQMNFFLISLNYASSKEV